MSRYVDLLGLAESLNDPDAPKAEVPTPGRLPAWYTPAFPEITPMKTVTLSDILSGHGETKESDGTRGHHREGHQGSAEGRRHLG
jgi:hypothetical protein